MAEAWLPIVLILASVSLGAVGQILYKKGMTGKLKKFSIKALVKLFFTPKILGGLIMYFVSSLFYLVALSMVQLSFAYPFFAVGYALITFLSWAVLHEKISKKRLSGVGIIILGVVLVGLS